jgi:hypothetical protein
VAADLKEVSSVAAVDKLEQAKMVDDRESREGQLVLQLQEHKDASCTFCKFTPATTVLTFLVEMKSNIYSNWCAEMCSCKSAGARVVTSRCCVLCDVAMMCSSQFDIVVI